MARHRVRAILAALLFAAILPLAATSAPLVLSLDELPGLSPLPLVVLPPPGALAPAYRFVPPEGTGAEVPWLSFTEPLELTAALGEERSYTLEVRLADGAVRTRKLTIDRKAPGLPTTNLAPGFYAKDLRLALTARDGSEIRYRLSSTLRPGSEAFKTFDPAEGIGIPLPSQGSETWRLKAYAVDGAGNIGPILSAVYRLAQDGMDYSFPDPAPAKRFAADDLAALPQPQEIRLDSGMRLLFSPPEGQNLLVAFSPNGESPSREDFVNLGGAGGRSLDLSWPLGWKGHEKLFLGLEKDGDLLYRPGAMDIALGGEAQILPPPPPSLSQGGEGDPSLLSFPPYDGSILVSIGGSGFAATKGPLSLGDFSGQVELAWYGQDFLGRKSSVQNLVLELPPKSERTSLAGLPPGGLSAQAIVLSTTGPGFLRYEISTDPGKPPREPTASSATIGQGLRLEPPEGSTTKYILRYRSFDSKGTALDEGASVAFTIDREAPPSPVLVADPPAYSSKALSLSWAPGDGTVMVAVDVDSRPGDYKALTGPLNLAGSPSGTVEYRIHAYAVDKAGNRSPDSPVRLVQVDLATLYADEAGNLSGDGSRDSPFANLDQAFQALASAPTAGSSSGMRRTIHARGTLTLSSPQVLKGLDVSIEGGYDADWKRSPGQSSAIHIGGEDGSTPIFSLRDSTLSLSSVSIRAPRLEGPLFDLQGSELRMASSSILASTGADLLLMDIRESRLGLSSCEILLGEGGSVSILAARNSKLSLENSSLTGSGATYFSALSLEGGSLSLRHSSLSSTALLGTRLMELRKAAIDIDAASFDVQGGGGFLSFGSFESCTGRLVNSHLLLSWEGSGSLFRIKGGKMAFLQDSFYGLTKKGSLRFFEADGPNLVLRNSIIAAKGEANVLISSPAFPSPGDVSANCLWGFKALVAGTRSLLDTASLNDYNGRGQAKTGLPNIQEDPFVTWGSSPPSTFALQDSSRCVDAGMILPDLGRDYGDLPRPSGYGPDIGADELQR